jgi:diguanylate cyclase (GGDEF)-like protein
LTAIVRRFLHPFLLPAGVVFGAAVALGATGLAAGWPRAVVDGLAYALAGGAFLAGWRFHRGRVAFAGVLVGLAWFAVAHFPDGATGAYVRQVAALLLPLSLAALSVGGERGLTTPLGLVRLALIALPAALAVRAGRTDPGGALALLAADWLPAPVSRAFAPLGLSDTALAAAALALGFLLVRALRRNGALEAGLFWSAAAGLGAAGPAAPEARGLLAAAAALALLAGLVETSYALAFRDELTGLPTRRALREALQQVGATYVLAMVDIDHFKKVNDRHGHDVGDEVLRMVAARLAQVGGGGRAFRYGGEEFTVLFAGRDLEEARPHLEDLRAAIAAAPFTLRGPRRQRKPSDRGRAAAKPRGGLKVTVSVGAAERSERLPAPDAVLKAADKALYRAKQSGRNRVCP